MSQSTQVNRRIVLASRPTAPRPGITSASSRFRFLSPARARCCCAPSTVARSLHARTDERRAVLRAAGGTRRGHGRRHGQPGGSLEPSRVQGRRLGALGQRLAGLRAIRRQRPGAPGRVAGASVLRPGPARHARLHRLHGPARHRQAPGRRDPGGGRRHRAGRRHRRTDRQAQGLPSGRRRRRCGKCRHAVQVLGFDACLDHHAADFAERLAEACPDGIDIYYERRRQGLRRRLPAAQRQGPDPGLRHRRPLQRHRAATRAGPLAGADGHDPAQAHQGAGLHHLRRLRPSLR